MEFMRKGFIGAINTEFVGSGFMSSKNQTDGCMLVVGLIIFYINLGEYMNNQRLVLTTVKKFATKKFIDFHKVGHV